MTENEFIEYINNLGITLNDIQLKQLNDYYELLIEWNQKINLTGITKKEDVYLKHFYDSACIQKVINLYNENSLCDVGTGAGFPGIVLKILFPNLKITLVDSLRKRIDFLNIVIENLNLENIETYHSRAEEFAKNHREKFDIVTARAVSKLNILLEYAIPMVKENKYFIPLKGHIDTEIEESRKALQLLDATICKRCEFLLPIENSTRNILLIRKNKKTDKKYPRKNSDIEKKPL